MKKTKEEKSEGLKMKTIAYWVVTGFLSLGIGASGIMAITQQEFLIEIMVHLGFPTYIMPINGTAYVLAAIAIIVPAFPLLKEWAYAGVILIMLVATIIHLVVGDTFAETFGALLFFSLAIISYFLRPKRLRLVLPINN